MTSRRGKGFTLIELMIVVAIAAILLAIGYPAYQSQVEKSRRSDGHSALTTTAQQLERCYSMEQDYAACGIDPGESDEGFYDMDNGTTTINTDTFTLRAEPQSPQDSDDCGWLEIDQTGAKTAEGDNEECW